MGYCLCVFDSDFDDDHEAEELAECDIEDFCDLAFFRSSIDCNLGAGRFPTLMRLLDSDTTFPASEVRALERELQEIAAAFRELPSERMKIAFQRVAEAHSPARQLCKCAQERFLDPLACITTFEYSLNDIGPFGRQLQEIAAAFRELPSARTGGAIDDTSENGGGAESSLYDSFRNADGANLFECLLELCVVAIQLERPIIFP
jgi:hypothetical protein